MARESRPAAGRVLLEGRVLLVVAKDYHSVAKELRPAAGRVLQEEKVPLVVARSSLVAMVLQSVEARLYMLWFLDSSQM